MNATHVGRWSCAWLLAGLILSPQVAAAQGKAPKPGANYLELYQRYLQSARSVESQGTALQIDWMSGLTLDPRAHRVNDLVTVRVVESVTATGKADSSLTKTGSASASIPKLFGVETKFPSFIDPTSLVGYNSDTAFKGGGTTMRAGELTATITARVAEVLPNGDLVLEGVREIDINGDRQLIVLTGVVRQADLLPRNVVYSSQIGQLSIRYFGNGLIKDNLKPSWLIRILNKVF